MTEDQVRKYATYLLPLVVGAGLLGCGVGGCVERDGTSGHPWGYYQWTPDMQFAWQKEREANRAWDRNVQSDLARPAVFCPLIIAGLALVGASVVLVVANESN